MTGDRMKVTVLATHTIANVTDAIAEELDLPKGYRSIGIITTDCDDATYCALDEATKAAAVEVVYGRSLYAGSDNASTRYAGEVIGILAGPARTVNEDNYLFQKFLRAAVGTNNVDHCARL